MFLFYFNVIFSIYEFYVAFLLLAGNVLLVEAQLTTTKPTTTTTSFIATAINFNSTTTIALVGLIVAGIVAACLIFGFVIFKFVGVNVPRRQNDQQLYYCSLCTSRYIKEVDLRLHHMRRHVVHADSANPIYQCWQCDETYSSIRRLAFHLEERHNSYKLSNKDFETLSERIAAIDDEKKPAVNRSRSTTSNNGKNSHYFVNIIFEKIDFFLSQQR